MEENISIWLIHSGSNCIANWCIKHVGFYNNEATSYTICVLDFILDTSKGKCKFMCLVAHNADVLKGWIKNTGIKNVGFGVRGTLQ